DIRSINKKLIRLGGFLTIGFIAVAPEALMILSPNSPDYWIARYVVPPVALGTFSQYLYTNYVNVELFHKKTPIIAVSSCFAALLNYILNYYAIGRFGYVSASYTTLISYMALMVLHFAAVRFILKEKVYDDGFIFASLALSILIGLSFILLYGDEMVFRITRYAAAVLLLGIFAFANKNDIMYFTKKGLAGLKKKLNRN
nr:polysaccharide biosynthesis C-terminal domain-containing protein [Lachnospiraceae bacterium]